jgi:phenylpropionate dioxygenase-like ring-hydroxylating dioxygenase large terminal subunit
MNAPHRPDLRWPTATNAVPKAIFDDPALFERELEAIFYGPEWHPVAVSGELPRRGDFKTIHVGHRPLLVVRGDDDRLRVFYNAC